MTEEIEILSKHELQELDEKALIEYILFLQLKVKDLTIKANKNCSDCENYLQSHDDLNLQLFFEDYRDCQDNCEKCNKQNRVDMCELQFNVLNHLAEQQHQLRYKLNALISAVMRKDDTGEKLLERLKEAVDEKEKSAGNMFL